MSIYYIDVVTHYILFERLLLYFVFQENIVHTLKNQCIC